jgi:DNA polymerase III subunit gamma/tau
VSAGSGVPAEPPADEESAPPPAAQDTAQGAAQVRQMWPQILEAVKNRRRFTWILLSQNAQIAGFDGSTLQLGFSNAGARDSFVGGGSEDVLVQALDDALGVQWKVEAIVDPSGGAGSGAGGAGPPGGGAPPGGSGGFGGGGGSSAPSSPSGAASGSAMGSATGSGMASPSARAGQGAAAGARQALATAQQAAPPSGAAGAAAATATAPAPSGAAAAGERGGGVPGQSGAPSGIASRNGQAAPVPYGGGLDDDVPAEDDPDLDESALSGHDLIMRDLGATVIEEIDH